VTKATPRLTSLFWRNARKGFADAVLATARSACIFCVVLAAKAFPQQLIIDMTLGGGTSLTSNCCGSYLYEAGHSITAGNGGFLVNSPSGNAVVVFQAGSTFQTGGGTITLVPGFDAKAGAAPVAFHARLAPPLVTTAGYDNSRTGANIFETTLTPANVSTSSFGLLGSYQVDGAVFAHPLYAQGVAVTGSSAKNVLYIATTNDTIYAFDADSPGSPYLAKQSYENPSQPCDPNIYATDPSEQHLLCFGNLSLAPDGIMGTPVIDLPHGRLYFVSHAGPNPGSEHFLHDVSVSSLQDESPPLVLHATGFTPDTQMQRPGLLLENNHIIAAFGSYADGGPYQGWVFSGVVAVGVNSGGPYPDALSLDGAISTLDPGLASNANVCMAAGNTFDPVHCSHFLYGDSIWMSGGGLAWDGSRTYFTTANNSSYTCQPPDHVSPIHGTCTSPAIQYSTSLLYSPPSGAIDYNNAILQVDPARVPPGNSAIAVTGSYTEVTNPAFNVSPNAIDQDLGSGRAILTPDGYVLAGGKSGYIYAIQANPWSFTSSADVCNQAGNTGDLIYSGDALWITTLYVWCSSDGLRAFSENSILAGGTSLLTPLYGPTALTAFHEGAAISLSANGTTNGILWAVLPSADPECSPPGCGLSPSGGIYTASLLAIDANTFQQLQNISLQCGTSPCSFQKFTPPMVANGRVYVATGSGYVLAFGLH